MSEAPKYAYPYPAQGYPAQGQGYYQGPPVQAPPQYYAAPPPKREPGFLDRCLTVLRCCFLIGECCNDSSIFSVAEQ